MYQNHQSCRKHHALWKRGIIPKLLRKMDRHPESPSSRGIRRSPLSNEPAPRSSEPLAWYKQSHKIRNESCTKKKYSMHRWEKAYKDAMSPRLQTFLLHRKIQAQSKTYTCVIPLATPWPLVYSKIKQPVHIDTTSSSIFIHRLQLILYSRVLVLFAKQDICTFPIYDPSWSRSHVLSIELLLER